jgi:hypothetical protein
MKKSSRNAVSPRPTGRKIGVEFLYINRTVCDRCIGTEAHLEEALSDLSGILETAGVEVSVRKILVTSEEMAKSLGFISSPTIRVNGKDIAAEFRESRCESCEACAGIGPVNCRIWVFQGLEYTEAPKAMIVDAVLREAYGGGSSRKQTARRRNLQAVPEDLRRFFTDSGGCGCR